MSVFIRAISTKEHKNNFMASAESTVSAIKELTNEYEEIWQKLEGYRKERAALIEDIIKTVKESNIRIRKQLCRCDNEELNTVLEEVVDDLDLTQQEIIKCALVKINIRYKQIEELGRKLEDLMLTLSHFRTVEPDYKDEVVIDFKKALSSKKDKMKAAAMGKNETITQEEGLEEVIDTREAPKSVVDSIESYLSRNQMEIDIEDEEEVLSAIIEEGDLKHGVDHSDIEREVADIEEEYPELDVTSILEATQEEYEELLEEDDECVEFTIENNITLRDIAQRVYSSGEYWEALYNYGSNKGRIDRVAAEQNVSYRIVCTKPGYLNGVELEFPLELVTYEAVTEEVDSSSRRLAA